MEHQFCRNSGATEAVSKDAGKQLHCFAHSHFIGQDASRHRVRGWEGCAAEQPIEGVDIEDLSIYACHLPPQRVQLPKTFLSSAAHQL